MEIMSMIDLVLVKKAMLLYVQDVWVVRGIGRSLSNSDAVLYQVRLVGMWIRRREVVNGTRRNRSEKYRKYQYMVGYVRCLESKIVEWDEGRNVEQMWEQVKEAMVDSIREMYDSARKGEKAYKMYGGMIS